MGYYVGDKPAVDLVVDPLRDEEPIDLTPYTEVDAQLWLDGELLSLDFYATINDEVIVVEWPGTSPFERAGIYELRLTVLNDDDAAERLPAVYLVACDDDGWHTLDSARHDWPDAPPYDKWLYELLEVAKQQVLEYAPILEENTYPPANYRRGQIMQARNLWNAAKVDPASGTLDDGTFMVQPFPLDWMVKQVLRPRSARPVVG